MSRKVLGLSLKDRIPNSTAGDDKNVNEMDLGRPRCETTRREMDAEGNIVDFIHGGKAPGETKT